MKFDVRLFAIAKERAGRASIEIELPEPATVADLKAALGRAVPSLEAILPRIRVAVDSAYAEDDAAIPAGAELAVIPPVSGG